MNACHPKEYTIPGVDSMHAELTTQRQPTPLRLAPVGDKTVGARSQGNNPCQTQVMVLGVPLLDHFPLDPVSYLRYKTVLSLTLL
jgi:hypothetical protein